MKNTSKNNTTLAALRKILLFVAVCGLLGCATVIAIERVREFIIILAEKLILHRGVSHNKWNVWLIKCATIAFIPILATTIICARSVWFLRVAEKVGGGLRGAKTVFNRALLRCCLVFVCIVFVIYAVFYAMNRGIWLSTPLHNEILSAYKINDIDIVMLPAFEIKKTPKLFHSCLVWKTDGNLYSKINPFLILKPMK